MLIFKALHTYPVGTCFQVTVARRTAPSASRGKALCLGNITGLGRALVGARITLGAVRVCALLVGLVVL